MKNNLREALETILEMSECDQFDAVEMLGNIKACAKAALQEDEA